MFFQKHLQILLNDASALGGIYFSGLLLLVFLSLGNTVVAGQIFWAIALSFLAAGLIRAFYFKPRPKREEHSNWIEKLDASSFPSVHSMRAVLLYAILAVYYRSLAISFILAIVTLAVCASRVLMRKHDVVDVVGGAIIGVVEALVILAIFY
ncbi:phosphatase PAP2 family protein [Candidatus Woesearchaeota archaeon]|nr:phosphatase PAP2 family protein [Candidatus Woesearchaeota archaeon]